MSQLAFSRSLPPGGNLGKRSCVSLGNRGAQGAAMHYSDACFVNVVIVQPSCPLAERPDYRRASTPKSTMTRGVNTIKRTFHISSCVGKLPCASGTFDGSIYENNPR
eukprot:6568698-Pyramimonas_sp.AAC.1